MVYCSNCGTETSEDANFCPKCGARTPRGVESGVEPHWRDEVDRALQAASRSIDEGLKKAREYIQEAVRDISPELEQARESLREVAEEVGDELRGAGEEIRRHTSIAHVYCPECGEKNTGYAKFCTKCGKEIK